MRHGQVYPIDKNAFFNTGPTLAVFRMAPMAKPAFPLQ